jgi:hypothetical protein
MPVFTSSSYPKMPLRVHKAARCGKVNTCKGDGWVTPPLTRLKDHNIRHRQILPNTTLYA